MNVLTQLIALANSLDSRGLYEEADMLDEALRAYAQKPMTPMEKMRWEAAQRRQGKNPYAPGQQPAGVQQQQAQQAAPQQQPSAADQQRAQQYAQQDQQALQQQRQKLLQDARTRDQQRAQQQADKFQGGQDQPQTGLAQQPTQKQQIQPKQQAGKQKGKMSPEARKRWTATYATMGKMMGMAPNATPQQIFRAIQRKYPKMYQRGYTAKDLLSALQVQQKAEKWRAAKPGRQPYTGSAPA